ncbi:SulP family inorganic anion transporter [Roseospira marina]|uniref:SulP family inorganic anion transporter n=1 Tax=Roseospira marina TaxID=140057 RepID=UPI0017E2455E|nr:SulP family inorganic anion transporter [Roseospira marina]MBB4314054.1 SulP family sulfate permease [Roseospira marina]MBB5087215.1 SulP family sulfate permease [Roseospira marina]
MSTRPVSSGPTDPDRRLSVLFTPKLVTVLREGYGLRELRADAVAGLTVAVVALPLSMAIAIASGVSPDRGLYAAIVGGFIISLVGGSRFQIGGPAGAFIVLVSATVAQHGVDGMLLATMMAGVILLGMGALRLGSYIQFIPYPVTVGFTSGIAVIIFASQIKDLLGLSLQAPEPGPLFAKMPVLWHSLPTVTPEAVAVALGTIVVIVGVKRLRPGWPNLLIAVALAAGITALADLPVATIGSHFGGIPQGLPLPSLPALDWAKMQAVLPSAVAFALLGSIESLLSAVVADGMTGRRHRSNCELLAQGTANIGSALFGGLCVTGAIARTATNIRAGAHGPVAGMIHAVALLVFVLVAAPLAAFIPLAALAGVLTIIAWNMVEKEAVWTLLRASRGDAAVLLVTFLLTVFRDLTEAIIVGFALGALLFIHRMSHAVSVEAHVPPVGVDKADGTPAERAPYRPRVTTDPGVVVYRISGAFFFGAVSTVGSVLDRIAAAHNVLVLDFAAVPFIDSSAANTIYGLARKAQRSEVTVYLAGASSGVRRDLLTHGLRQPLVHWTPTVDEALERIRAAGADTSAT